MANLGQQIGNYCLVKSLGSGGFAEVFLGEHVQRHSNAAIKIANNQLTQEQLSRFWKEVALIASFRHPNIITIEDFGLDNNTPHIIMEFAPNGSLLDRHPEGQIVPINTLIGYVNQIAAALQYTHDRQKIHCDLKPENVLIASEERLLLADFGIAAFVQPTVTKQTGDLYGSPYYIAPEQIGKMPQPASDQYALGIMVYLYLTGHYPFDGQSDQEILRKHLTLPPPPLRGYVPTIHPLVEQVVLRALAKKPEDRYPTIREFAEQLKRTAAPEITRVRQAPTLYIYKEVISLECEGFLWSPDGKYIAFTDYSGLHVWEPRTDKKRVYKKDFNFAWSPDGKYIASIHRFRKASTTGSLLIRDFAS